MSDHVEFDITPNLKSRKGHVYYLLRAKVTPRYSHIHKDGEGLNWIIKDLELFAMFKAMMGLSPSFQGLITHHLKSLGWEKKQ